MASHYIVITYNTGPNAVRRLIKYLEKHGRVEAVAVMVVVEDARILGAVRQIVGKEAISLRGYLPLPRP